MNPNNPATPTPELLKKYENIWNDSKKVEAEINRLDGITTSGMADRQNKLGRITALKARLAELQEEAKKK